MYVRVCVSGCVRLLASVCVNIGAHGYNTRQCIAPLLCMDAWVHWVSEGAGERPGSWVKLERLREAVSAE